MVAKRACILLGGVSFLAACALGGGAGGGGLPPSAPKALDDKPVTMEELLRRRSEFNNKPVVVIGYAQNMFTEENTFGLFPGGPVEEGASLPLCYNPNNPGGVLPFKVNMEYSIAMRVIEPNSRVGVVTLQKVLVSGIFIDRPRRVQASEPEDTNRYIYTASGHIINSTISQIPNEYCFRRPAAVRRELSD